MGNFDLGESLEKLQKEEQYFISEEGFLCRWKQTNNGRVPEKLCNFDAWIEEEIVEDNGLDQGHSFAVKGKQKDRALPRIEVPAGSFSSLNWIFKWGSKAILEPGQSVKDRVRHAIQLRSTNTKATTFYTHTGWRGLNGVWVYLTGAGAIGGKDIFVRLPKELDRYSLPATVKKERQAIQTSLSFLEIGKPEITYPLFAYLYLSPLTTLIEKYSPNFIAYLYGDTGSFKSTLAVLLLSHLGQFTTVSKLQNFDDSINSLEKRAFTLKDTLMVLDDYHPSHNRQEAMNKEKTAQSLIRKYSNRTGRGRLNSDTTDKGRYEPRGLLLITGEELVSLQSTLARSMIIELSRGDIDKNKLKNMQLKAELLPHAMSSYIQWLRPRIPDIQDNSYSEIIELRDKASRSDQHGKLSEQVAFLAYSMKLVLSWLTEKKVITDTQEDRLWNDAWEIFTALSAKNNDRIRSEDPVKRFVDIFNTCVTQGKIKIEDKTANRIIGDEKGELLGYFDESFYYLLPTALWNSLQKYNIAEGTYFPVNSKTTFYKMLKTQGIIEAGNNQTTKTERIKGKSQKVLKVKRVAIDEKE